MEGCTVIIVEMENCRKGREGKAALERAKIASHYKENVSDSQIFTFVGTTIIQDLSNTSIWYNLLHNFRSGRPCEHMDTINFTYITIEYVQCRYNTIP